MVGIQIGSEQEEKKREEERGFENIVDFNITSNAAEKLARVMFRALKISSSITSL